MRQYTPGYYCQVIIQNQQKPGYGHLDDCRAQEHLETKVEL